MFSGFLVPVDQPAVEEPPLRAAHAGLKPGATRRAQRLGLRSRQLPPSAFGPYGKGARGVGRKAVAAATARIGL